jgi:FAD synthetase
MKRVLAFGSFDPLHTGHLHFLEAAKALGDHLTVVVTSDSSLQASKNYQPFQPASERLQAVTALPFVDHALLGEEHPPRYKLLQQLNFDVLALGYDQAPADEEARLLLDQFGHPSAALVRLAPFHPDRFKGRLLRPDSSL